MRKSWILLVALAAGCTANGHGNDGKEKDEGDATKVKFSEAPPAVQKTLTEQAGGVTIDTVDKEVKDGRTTYEADAVIGGTNYEIRVDADGKLIEKKVDKEEGEKK